jgi:hypothetical protein
LLKVTNDPSVVLVHVAAKRSTGAKHDTRCSEGKHSNKSLHNASLKCELK